MELLYVLIAVFLFFFVVKPIFGYVADGKRIKAHYDEEAHKQEEWITSLAQAPKIAPYNDAPTEQDPTYKEEENAPPDGVLVGTDTDTNEPLYIPDQLRGKHLYLIGKTRTGKTTLIKNIIIQTIEQGHGLCSIDPHGDQALDLLTTVPEERIKDVIYFDPTQEWCPAFNFFRLPYPPYKLTEDIISVFQLFFDSWGPRMEHLLRYSCLTLLMSKFPATLFDLRRMLVEDNHRALILSTVEDETIQAFWEHEFPSMGKASADPILNKLSAFLVPSSPMHRLFSQPENGLDFPQMLREKKILIVNLAKGKVGEMGAKLLGGMIVAGISGAGLAQADIAPEKRNPFHLFIDEYQNYCVKSMEDILSESAKYKLFLTLAHQTLGQISSSMQASILGNVATIVAFQISATDAGVIGREMKRTRYSVVGKDSKQPEKSRRPIDEFVKAVVEDKQKYRSTLEEKNIRPILDRLTDPAQAHYHSTFTGEDHTDDPPTTLSYEEHLKRCRAKDISGVERWRELQREDARDIEILTASEATYETYKNFFPDLDIKPTTFPDTDDFINMQPRHAFIRKERAENVFVFKTNAPPPAVAGIKGKILHNMREIHAERLQARPQATPKLKLAVGANSAPNANVRTIKKPVLKSVPKRKSQAQDYDF